jgi:hypothetical protein
MYKKRFKSEFVKDYFIGSNFDAILAITSKDPLRVFIWSILRPKMK